MGVGQLSESDAVDALRLPFYSSSHPTGSHGWRNQFDLGNPELVAYIETSSINRPCNLHVYSNSGLPITKQGNAPHKLCMRWTPKFGQVAKRESRS